MESCWMETLDRETEQGEAQVRWMEMLDGEILELIYWMAILDGEVLQTLDGGDGDVGWGW